MAVKGRVTVYTKRRRTTKDDKAPLKRKSKYDIVDSGASRTYVRALQRLLNARPGGGSVQCANGQREKIAEVGDLGPLKDAQKVLSFGRTLVSVSDLVEQFGVVAFDHEGVFVLSPSTPSSACPQLSRIGDKTRERLFSFDLDALGQHHTSLRSPASRSTAPWGVADLLRPWGCAKGCAGAEAVSPVVGCTTLAQRG